MTLIPIEELRFFNADLLIGRAFDLDAEPCWWLKPTQIAKAIGVEPTRSATIQVGVWARHRKLKFRKSNGVRLILMPPPKSPNTK